MHNFWGVVHVFDNQHFPRAPSSTNLAAQPHPYRPEADQLNCNEVNLRYPSHFGSIPAQGPWNEGNREHHPVSQVDYSEDRTASYVSQSALNGGTATGIPDGNRPERNIRPGATPSYLREEENRRRSAYREVQRPYRKEMALAHAQNRDPHITILVSPSGTVIGLKSPWHRAARLCARQTLNFKVRTYKARREYWNAQVEIVASKLAQQFTYSRPLDISYLGKFLKNTLKTIERHGNNTLLKRKAKDIPVAQWRLSE